MVKSSSKNRRGQLIEVEDSGGGEPGSDGVISLFGKWQTEPLCLPAAVNGIVPKVNLSAFPQNFAIHDVLNGTFEVPDIPLLWKFR